MKKNYTHLSILIDRSGSMTSIKKSIIEGFNTLINDQKKEPGELTVSLIQFDSYYQSYTNGLYGGIAGTFTGKQSLRYIDVNDFANLDSVTLLNESNYQPEGGTPLNDSLARLIKETGDKLALMREEDRPEKVIVVVMTDGEENTSTEHTTQSVKTMIEHQEKIYNWKFIYIGANQDAFGEAKSRGMSGALNFTANHTGTTAAYMATTNTLSSMRGATMDSFMSTDYSEELGSTYAIALEKEEKKEKEKKPVKTK